VRKKGNWRTSARARARACMTCAVCARTYAVQLAARSQASSRAQRTVPQEGAELKRIPGLGVHLCDFPFEDLAFLVPELVHGIVPAGSAPARP